MKNTELNKITNGTWQVIYTEKCKYEKHKYFIKKITKTKVVFNDLWNSWWGDMPVLKKDITKVE